ncbi:MAG TPA: DoxX family membrane protein [Chitinophagales bacterium]|nr:DoxX family membrane protein [Chitinophagales bacterium]
MKNSILWFCRLFTGALFIFSGLVKANDPVGFGIKLEEYYDVFAERWSWTSFLFKADWLIESVNLQAAFLTSLEVALGILLILGIWKNLTTWLLLLLILFFTWLTGYSAITGSVTDCGCFGDFIPLTPLQSFYKDLVLLVLILIIFILRKNIKPILSPIAGFTIAALVTGFAVYVNAHVLKHDVFLDWRPYAVGDSIVENMQLPPNPKKDVVELNYVYTNKKTGETVELAFLNTELEDKTKLAQLTKYSSDKENWNLDTSFTKVKVKGDRAKISDFAVSDEQGDFITDQILSNPDYTLMVVSASFDHTSKLGWEKINAMQKDAEKEGVFTYALVGEGRDEIEKFRHNNQTAFPFYTGDYKVCLTIARTNPNVVLLKEGVVIDKWAWRDLPSFEAIKKEHFADRKPTELIPITNEMFGIGVPVAEKIAASTEPYNEFFLQDSTGNDVTAMVINDTANICMVILNELTADKLTADKWKAILPVMKGIDSTGNKLFVVSSGSFNILKLMKKASGLEFDLYTSDKDVLYKIMEQNTGVIYIKQGKVVAKFPDDKLPADFSFLNK